MSAATAVPSGAPRRRLAVAAAAGVLAVSGVLAASAVASATSSGPAKKQPPQVLYVGSYNGVTPTTDDYSTIQAAVNAASPGDWILIGPGDYHESGDAGATPAQESAGDFGSVTISTPDLHLRGMDRNKVIVDDTLASASTPCSSAPSDQNDLGGAGRNGIVVWKADGVSIDNLTVCNFLAGSGDAGNGVWWNGGADSGLVGLKGYEGSYLTATSTYFVNSDPNNKNVCGICSLYGIFSSNAEGSKTPPTATTTAASPTLSHLYANNMSDSGIYIGACHRVCNASVTDSTFEDNALGYSGTNSGGAIIIESNTFDDNKDGLDTNTALTGDPPPPQDGKCTGRSPSTVTGTASCWVVVGNTFADNNNPNVPIEGTAGLGPTGTGMTLSGGRDDTVMDNKFVGNEAWGILFAPYPDSNLSSDGKTCASQKGVDATSLGIGGLSCLFNPMNDALVGNEFSGNGTFGNASNSDFGNLVVGGHQPVNCFSGNTEWNAAFTVQTGAATSGDTLDGLPQLTPTACGTKTAKVATGTVLGTNTDTTMLLQAECDAGLLSGALCGGATYPQATDVVMGPVPSADSPTMPDPCVGVPANQWCVTGAPIRPHHAPAGSATGGSDQALATVRRILAV